jgi:hypothetical protein
MKKFFLVLFILVFFGAAGFAGWYFLLKEDPLKVEFYGDKEILEYMMKVSEEILEIIELEKMLQG